jgi:hypothetical protein
VQIHRIALEPHSLSIGVAIVGAVLMSSESTGSDAASVACAGTVEESLVAGVVGSFTGEKMSVGGGGGFVDGRSLTGVV